MAKLDDSINRLKTAVSKSKAKNKAQLAEAISQLQSYLIFLNSSTLSVEVSRKLADRLRNALVPVYTAYTQPALQFAAALASEIYETKILSDFTAGKHTQKMMWNSVLESLLSGVLDYHDQHLNDKCKEAIGSALYSTLCGIFFSVSIAHMSVDMRCAGYTLLSECADGHKSNQKRLRDAALLGGLKLGALLWRTRDYLVIENILNLFARMIPTTNGSAMGRAERDAFIRSVFVQSSSENVKTGEELAKMLEHVPTSDWDQTALKIIDVLAHSNIAFPQPFAVTEIDVCGRKKPSDRLYVDDKGFVANVPIEDDLYESLWAPYTSVIAIKVTRCPTATQKDDDCVIVVSFNSPPLLGKDPIQPTSTTDGATESTLTFSLTQGDFSRFSAALESRRLGKYVNTAKKGKLSVASSATKLEMTSGGNLIDKGEFEQRIENLSQIYETNEPSEEALPVCRLSHANVAEEICKSDAVPLYAKPLSSPDSGKDGAPADTCGATRSTTRPDVSAAHPDSCGAAGSDAVLADVSAKTLVAPITPLHHTASQKLREAAFGLSEDELSELECPPAPPQRPKKKHNVDRVVSKCSATVSNPIVLSSDDEASISSPTRPTHAAQKTRRTAIIISDDDIEEVAPPSKIADSSISRRRSVLRMNPLAPAKNLAQTKSKNVARQDSFMNPRDIVTSTPKVEPMKPAAVIARNKKEDEKCPFVANKDKPMNETSTPPSDPYSSPVATKSVRTNVKSALRRKDGALTEPVKLSNARPKRKRSQNESSQPNVEVPDLDNTTRKRAKREPAAVVASVPPEQTESQVLKPRKTAAVRATKRYHAKRGRNSSPTVLGSAGTDYDAVPENPSSSSRPPKEELPPVKSRRGVKDKITTSEPAKSTRQTRTRAKAKTKDNKTVPEVSAVDRLGVEDEHRALTTREAEEPNVNTIVQAVVNAQDPITASVEVQNVCSAKFVVAEAVANTQHGTISGQNVETERDIVPDPRLESIFETLQSEKPGPKSRQAPWNSLAVISERLVADSAPVKVAKNDEAVDVSTEGTTASPVVAAIREESIDNTEFVQESEAFPPAFEPEVQKATVEFPMKDPASVDVEPATNREDKHASKRKRVVVKSPTRSIDAATVDHVSDGIAGVQEEPPSKFSPLKPRTSESRKQALSSPYYFNEDARLSKYQAHASPQVYKTTEEKRMPHGVVETQVNRGRGIAQPSTEELAAVLEELHQAILRKVTGKIDGVRQNVRISRDKLLAEGAADLEEMHGECIHHYNNLVDMEEEYATFCRDLTQSFEELAKADQDIHARVKSIIATHDRGSLSKKLPLTLLPPTLPASLSQFKK